MSSVTKKKTPAATPRRPVAVPKSAPNGKIIHLLVKANPKRGDSAARFAYYRNGMPVEDYVARVVKAGAASSVARADLRWDTARKFIAIR
jgi:hypothetical protein